MSERGFLDDEPSFQQASQQTRLTYSLTRSPIHHTTTTTTTTHTHAITTRALITDRFLIWLPLLSSPSLSFPSLSFSLLPFLDRLVPTASSSGLVSWRSNLDLLPSLSASTHSVCATVQDHQQHPLSVNEYEHLVVVSKHLSLVYQTDTNHASTRDTTHAPSPPASTVHFSPLPCSPFPARPNHSRFECLITRTSVNTHTRRSRDWRRRIVNWVNRAGDHPWSKPY